MAFDLESWSLDEAKGLAEFYNTQIVDIPGSYAVSAEDFDWGIRHPRYDEHVHKNLSDEKIIVAKRDGNIVGFVHLADETEPHDDDKPCSGIIRFLSYTPGDREAGQMLLDAAESHLRAREFDRIYAFLKNYIYRFYMLGYGVYDQHGHITGLMGINGYQVYKGEIFLDWPNFEVEEPVIPDSSIEIRVIEEEGPGDRPNLTVKAYRDGESFGICATISLAYRNPVDDLQDTFFVRGLGVDDDVQHQGWGRYLLMRSHWENYKVGYKHASISTGTKNYRAQLFYTNYGYRVRDTWYEYVKHLQD